MGDAERKLLTIVVWMALTFAGLFVLLRFTSGEVCQHWADQLAGSDEQTLAQERSAR